MFETRNYKDWTTEVHWVRRSCIVVWFTYTFVHMTIICNHDLFITTKLVKSMTPVWATCGRLVIFMVGIPVSFISKTDLYDLTEILLKVTLNTNNPSHPTSLILLPWFPNCHCLFYNGGKTEEFDEA